MSSKTKGSNWEIEGHRFKKETVYRVGFALALARAIVDRCRTTGELTRLERCMLTPAIEVLHDCLGEANDFLFRLLLLNTARKSRYISADISCIAQILASLRSDYGGAKKEELEDVEQFCAIVIKEIIGRDFAGFLGPWASEVKCDGLNRDNLDKREEKQ